MRQKTGGIQGVLHEREKEPLAGSRPFRQALFVVPEEARKDTLIILALGIVLMAFLAFTVLIPDTRRNFRAIDSFIRQVEEMEVTKRFINSILTHDTYGRSPSAQRDRPYPEKHKLLKIKQIQRIPFGRLEKSVTIF